MDEESAKVHPEAPPADSRRGGFEVVSSWEVVDEPPTTEAVGAAPARATRRLAEWVSALFFVPYAIALVVAARAVRPEIASWLKISGEQTPFIMIAVFLGLAILGGVLSRLLGAGIVRLGASLPGGRRLKRIGAGVAVVVLLAVAVAASLEGSAYVRARRALKAVAERRARSPGVPLTRRDVEATVGRPADESGPGEAREPSKAVYVWHGVFRSYRLRADFLIPSTDPDRPAPPSERGSNLLIWINDVIE
jgi:hypothetical protein